MKTMDSMCMSHKKYRPPLTPTSFYQPANHDIYSRHSTYMPQSEYRFAGGTLASRHTVSSRRKSRLCSACLAVAALIAALAVLAVAALAFYMGALRPDSNEPIIAFEGTMRVSRGDVYGGAPNGPATRERARRYTAALRQIYAEAAPLNDAFVGAHVTSFGEARSDVYFRIYLDRRKIPNSIANIEDMLKNSLLNDMASKKPAFGQIKIDPSSLIIKRDLEHTYRSESNIKEVMNENFESPQSGSSPQSQSSTKDKALQTRLGVVRKTTIKPNQTTAKRKTQVKTDPDEPDVDLARIPVIKGSFEISKTEADIIENKNADKITIRTPTATKLTSPRPISTTTTKQKIVTIMPTSNIKTKHDTSTKRVLTTKPSTTPLTTTTAVTSTSTSSPATNKVSEVLLDLLSKENKFKDLPNIDSLFTVTPAVDIEPWRPITKPELPPMIEHSTRETEYLFQDEAEERIGVAEVVEDLSALEGLISEFKNKTDANDTIKNNTVEPQIHNVDPDLAADIYIPKPVYTSFTRPTFSSTIKETEMLGGSFPKPHPLPVDKISFVVSDEKSDTSQNYENKFNLDGQIIIDDGKPIMKPPKEKVSTYELKVLNEFDKDEENKDILKENVPDTSEKNDVQMFKGDGGDPLESRISDESGLSLTSEKSKIVIKVTTYRPPSDKIMTNAKVQPTWEFVNSSSKENRNFNKRLPERHFNATLQAVITNGTEIKNTTPAFSSGLSLLKNLTEFIQKITTAVKENRNDMNKTSVENVDKPHSMVQNSSMPKVPSKTTILKTTTTTAPTPITLLPAKSNLGINRPLRPRPKYPKLSEMDKVSDTTFTKISISDPDERDDLFSDLKHDSVFNKASDIIASDLDVSTNHKNINQSYVLLDKKNNSKTAENLRLPKTDGMFRDSNITSSVSYTVDSEPKVIVLPTATEFILTHPSTQGVAMAEKVKSLVQEVKNHPGNISGINEETRVIFHDVNTTNDEAIPTGTHKVLFHVSGSVSTKKSNRTKSLDTYQLPLEQDVILEIPKNQSYSLTADKLKQLAHLATITDYSNHTFFDGSNVPPEPKALSSSFTVNHAGLKVLTKTFNKLPTTKDDEKSFDKYFVDSFNSVEDAFEKNNNVTDECQKNSFKCKSGRCLPVSSRCNKLLECADGEDETTCTCADYLKSELLTNKICDGVVDCWDFSDENDCDWCSNGDYICSNARMCIAKEKICDGTLDCPLGDDEKSCVALAENLSDTDDDYTNSLIPYNTEGFLMIRKRGTWGRFCLQNFDNVISKAKSSLQLSDLGRAVCRSMTFDDIDDGYEDKESQPFSSDYWELGYNEKPRPSETRLTFRRATCPKSKVLRVRCSSLDCGVRPYTEGQQPRIVGGSGAVTGSWPWQAALYRDGEFQCGATLISQDWLLSAGHCFYQAENAYWVARVGALRRGASPRGPYEATSRVQRVIVHPNYAAAGFRNDLALLKVSLLELSSRIRPACLPPLRAEPPHGALCTVVGWGQLQEQTRIFPDTLQEVELPVISTAECKRRTLFLPLYKVTDDMFCAGYDRGGRDACLGDSGGPLMCQGSDNRWYMHGVTSNGYGCARASRPGVYIKVSHYIQWINNTIERHSNELHAKENHFDDCKGHRCPLGECLPQSSVCNGFIECSDGSDERNCD